MVDRQGWHIYYLINRSVPVLINPKPTMSKIMRGRGNPVSGIGSPASVAVGVGSSTIIVGCGVRAADGVASPNTCVPLFNISNV